MMGSRHGLRALALFAVGVTLAACDSGSDSDSSAVTTTSSLGTTASPVTSPPATTAPTSTSAPGPTVVADTTTAPDTPSTPAAAADAVYFFNIFEGEAPENYVTRWFNVAQVVGTLDGVRWTHLHQTIEPPADLRFDYFNFGSFSDAQSWIATRNDPGVQAADVENPIEPLMVNPALYQLEAAVPPAAEPIVDDTAETHLVIMIEAPVDLVGDLAGPWVEWSGLDAVRAAAGDGFLAAHLFRVVDPYPVPIVPRFPVVVRISLTADADATALADLVRSEIATALPEGAAVAQVAVFEIAAGLSGSAP
jgi:hypothetical protein